MNAPALASGPSTDADLAGSKTTPTAGSRDGASQQATALEAAHATIKKLQAELDRLAAANNDLQQQLHDAHAEREAWMNEHDAEAHAAHEAELAEALRLADQRIAQLQQATAEGADAKGAGPSAEAEAAWSAEREALQQRIDELTAELAAVAGANAEAEQLRAEVERLKKQAGMGAGAPQHRGRTAGSGVSPFVRGPARPGADGPTADDQAEISQLRSTNKSLQTRINELQPLAARSVDLQRQLRRAGSTVGDDLEEAQRPFRVRRARLDGGVLGWRPCSTQPAGGAPHPACAFFFAQELQAQLELLMLANHRLAADLAAVTAPPPAESPLPAEEATKAMAAAQELAKHLEEASPAQALAKVHTLLEDKRDECRKTLLLMVDGDGPARKDLATIVNFLEDTVAELAPRLKHFKLFEKVRAAWPPSSRWCSGEGEELTPMTAVVF